MAAARVFTLASSVWLSVVSLACASLDVPSDDHDFHCPPSADFNDKNAYRVPVGDGFFLPVLSSKAVNSRVHLAIVVLHGSRRNAEEYFTNMITVAAEQKCGGFGMAVVAPALPSVTASAECTADRWGKGGSTSERALTWSGTREWALGQKDDRVTGGVSSFHALDKVIEWAVAGWRRSLRAIVVTGFSTGAQLALRWSIFSTEGADGRSSGRDLPLRLVVASPSAVTYLDSTRPIENCTVEEVTTRNFSCSDYALPESGSRRRGRSVARTCNGEWDDYQYGLGGLANATSDTVAADVAGYLGEIANSADLTATLRARFKSKDIRFLVGTEDTKPCGQGSCADSCEAMITGSNRLQRMLNFKGHLQGVFGVEPSFGVFDGPHEHLLAFRSAEFIEWGFPGLIDEDGNCDIESQLSRASCLAAPHSYLVALVVSFGLMPFFHQPSLQRR